MLIFSFFSSVIFIIIALSLVVLAYMLAQLVKSFSSGTNSIEKLVNDIDVKLQNILDEVKVSVNDINQITKNLNENMSSINNIVKNSEHISYDVKTTLHTIEKTLVPLLIEAYSLVAGIKKGLEVWKKNDQ